MTTVCTTISQLREQLGQVQKRQKTIGFVPTMGFLHDGHLSLVDAAKEEADVVVMSIFVNPTQFGPNEDFDAYPRDLERDIALATKRGVDYIFAPSVREMYPRESDIRILPGAIAQQLCGASRPTHFDGVLTVILKLFNIVRPTYAYFGLKDAQQVAVIETFMEDYNFETTIRRVPIVREEDGLAKSSRNVNLTKEERRVAPNIYRALVEGEERLLDGEAFHLVEEQVARRIEEETGGVIDYVSILSYPALQTPRHGEEVILACAVQFSKTRLIDNVIVRGK